MPQSRATVRLLLVTALAFAAPPLLAQARVTGVVRDTAGAPVADVGVLLMPDARSARTDAAGRFRFDSVAPTAHRLHFRRLGFLPDEMSLMVRRDTTLELTLRPRPRLLDTVVVTARGCSRVYFEGFLCRRSTTPGVFLTEADILAKNPRFLADIFLDIDGFHVEAVPTPMGPSRRVTTTQSRCIVTLYNGRRSPVGGSLDASAQMAGSAGRTYDAMDAHVPADLIGVEIYPPGYQTPLEYGGLAVAVNADRRSVDGSPFRGRTRRVPPAEERCVLVNYWTTAALRDPDGGGLLGLLRRIF